MRKASNTVWYIRLLHRLQRIGFSVGHRKLSPNPILLINFRFHKLTQICGSMDNIGGVYYFNITPCRTPSASKCPVMPRKLSLEFKVLPSKVIATSLVRRKLNVIQSITQIKHSLTLETYSTLFSNVFNFVRTAACASGSKERTRVRLLGTVYR